MHTLSLVSRILNSARTLFAFEPNTATATPAAPASTEAAPAPAAKPAEADYMGLIPGANLLKNATGEAPTVPEEIAEWQEGEPGDDDEVTEIEPKPKVDEPEAAPAEEAKNEPAEDVVPTEWPESAKKRVDKLTAQRSEAQRERDEAKAKIAELETKLATAPQAQAPVRLQPTFSDPLAHITNEEGLNTAISDAEIRKAWALEHWDDGGEFTIPGRDEPLILDKDQTRKLFSLADNILTKAAPQRREYLKLKAQAGEYLKSQHPEYLDASKPEGQAFQSFASQLTQLQQFPQWEVIVADIVRGQMARNAADQAKTAAAKPAEGKPETKLPTPETPIAPAVPKPSAKTVVPPTESGKRPRPPLKASMNHQDLMKVL